jgi:hypothetical protein
MADKKKVTLKDLNERVNVLAYNINHLKMLIDNIGFAVSNYIDFKGDTEEYKKRLENIQKTDKLRQSMKDTLKNDEK